MNINRRSLIQKSLMGFIGGVTATAGSAVSSSVVSSALSKSLITKMIPSSGEQLPVVGLGTNGFRSITVIDERQAMEQVVRIFSEHGGLIDTAPSYGQSESILGDLISELDISEKMFYATKCDESGGEKTHAQIAQSLQYLDTSPMDLMQIHNLKHWQANLPVLREAKEQGLIRYIGITTWRHGQFSEMAKIMQEEPLDFIQLNYSILDREAEKILLPLAVEKGIAVLANVPYGRGRIFSAVRGQNLPEWATEFCSSWGQFFLKFNASHPAITASIPGTTTPRYALDNVGGAMGRLPTQEERQKQLDFFSSL